MNEMPEWCNDEVLDEFCAEIVQCLITYGKLPEVRSTAAIQIDSGLCSHAILATEMSRALLFHELPYFYAISLLYGRSNPQCVQRS